MTISIFATWAGNGAALLWTINRASFLSLLIRALSMTDISHISIASIQTLHFTSTGTGQTPYCQSMLAHHPTGPILSICSEISSSYLDTSPSVCAVACRPSRERRECHRADAQTRPKVPSGLTSATEHASLAAPFSCTMSVLEPTRKTPWVESPYVRSLLVSSIFPLVSLRVCTCTSPFMSRACWRGAPRSLTTASTLDLQL